MPRAPRKPTRKAAAPTRKPTRQPTRQPIDHSDDPDMPESMAPRRASAIDAALQSGSRIGRITGPNGEGYDPSRDVEEYGNTPDFAAAKAAREAGVQVNRYPGKCFNCSKSIPPMGGETVHVSKVPEEKRRAGSSGQWMVKCTRASGSSVNRYPGKCFNCSTSIAPGQGEIIPTRNVPEHKRRSGSSQQVMVQCKGASCMTKGGKVKGPAVRTTDAAQGTKVNKVKVGKAGGARHSVEVTHEGNTSRMSWHPRSGVHEFDIHPAHEGIGMEDHLHRMATGTAAREGYIQPRPLKDN